MFFFKVFLYILKLLLLQFSVKLNTFNNSVNNLLGN